MTTGAIPWRAGPNPAPDRRQPSPASLLPLPFLDSPLPVGGLLLVSGMAIAPTLIASVAVIESSVPTAG